MLETVLVLIVILLFLYYGVPLLYMWGLRAQLTRRTKQRRQLALTFDDGPGDCLTPRVLDFLRENNGKATFFLLGRNVAGREDLVLRIAAEGHEVGAHGFNHVHHWKANPLRTITDINRGWSAIDDALGRKGGVYPFRPPYGKLNLLSLLYLWGRRAPIIYWTVDTGDTWLRGKRDERAVKVLDELSDGAVVLVHDFDRSEGEMADKVMRLIGNVLVRAEQAAMSAVTISEVLNDARN